jgi:YfiH family protein
MRLNTEGEAPFIEIEGFSDMGCVKHGFTTRFGGVSQGIYESLNMGLHLEDNIDDVRENYRRIGSSIGIDSIRISAPNQVHKSNILVVTEEDAGDGIARELTHFDIDAQITNVKNIPLIVYTADCVPILLADPVSKVVGTVHAGWRGSVDGIAAKTVEKMVETYGCPPETIHAII